MILLVEHTCDKCGHYGEAWLCEANIHIKKCCGKCRAYVKFYERRNMPDITELKNRIWKLTGENVEMINNYKLKTNFPTKEAEYRTNMPLAYYQLYFFIREDFMSEA
jgi:hypothetical protein